MKLYNTTRGILLNEKDRFYVLKKAWDELLSSEKIREEILSLLPECQEITGSEQPYLDDLLPPIGQQEVWASGVTYLRSKSARMEESEAAGGGNFYDRVYVAERPELFFKASPYRVVGHGQEVRIRTDSEWNVPEPELTLLISPKGKLQGYTIGNDMSSRDIEGENPLYLPQAKTYDGSCALGPCIYLSEKRISGDTLISLTIEREGGIVFSDEVQLSKMKRNFEELISFLYRELSFPKGCFLMTGTGIVPPNDFTLQAGDKIQIAIDGIGILRNRVGLN